MPIMILVVQVGGSARDRTHPIFVRIRVISAEGGVRSSASGRDVGAPCDDVKIGQGSARLRGWFQAVGVAPNVLDVRTERGE